MNTLSRRFSKLCLFLACLTFAVQSSAAPSNEKCPIMTDDAIDQEYVVELVGEKVFLCCSKCEKLCAENSKYYTKAALELGLLPQFKGKEASLGLDEVKLLPQRFCPIKSTYIVTPASPSVEYKGEKVYFSNARAQKTWEADPDGVAKKAIAAGLLPQLAGK